MAGEISPKGAKEKVAYHGRRLPVIHFVSGKTPFLPFGADYPFISLLVKVVSIANFC